MLVMKRILFIAALFLSSNLFGQGELLTFGVGGGLNTFFFNPSLDRPLDSGEENAESVLSWGFTVSSRYIFFFQNSNLGLGSGVDFLQYRSKAKLDGCVVTPSYDHENGQAFDLIESFVGWEEKERMYTFEFPLGLYYKVPFSDKANMVVGLGGKLVVPVLSRYEVSEGTYAVSGYYPQTNVIIKDLPHHGFVNSEPYASGAIKTKLAFSVYGELGFNFSVSEKVMFHSGFYCNYGLSNVLNDKRKKEPDLWDDFFVDTESLFATRIVDKVQLFSAGLKFGITLPSNNRDQIAAGTKSEVKTPSRQPVVE